MLNALHVPLVDDGDDSLVGAGVNHLEEILVLFVDENALELGEVNGHGLDVPVDLVLIQALLGKLRWLRHRQSDLVLVVLVRVEFVTAVHKLGPQEARDVHSGLMHQSRPGSLIELRTQEVNLRASLLSLLESEFDLETGLGEVEV